MPIMQTGVPSNYVPPEGELNRKIVFIGEAPGMYEVREKRPFVGPAGSILAQCMQHAGIARQECYITNVFKMPVKKSGGTWKIGTDIVYHAGRGFTEAGRQWVDALRQELKDSEANIYVPMGEAAICALLGMQKVLKVRGSIYSTDFWGDGRKCMPCIHPAAAIDRQGSAGEAGGSFIRRYFIIYDLRRAKQQSEFPEVHYPEAKFITNPSYAETLWWLEDFNRWPELAVDVEVYNQEISCFGVGTKDTVLVVPFTMGNKDYWTLEQECQIWLAIDKLMQNKEVRKVFQNGLFDMWVLLRNNNIFVRGPVDDTMIAWQILYPDVEFKKSLDVIASVYTLWPYYKDEFKIWTKRQLTKDIHGDMKILWDYNGKDVAATAESITPLRGEIARADNIDTYQRTVASYPPALYMQLRGIKANRVRLEKLKAEIAVRIDELQEELNTVAGRALNPNSPKQLREHFYGTLGITPYLSPKTKRVTVDDNALKRMCKATTKRPAVKEAKIIREIRSLKKLKGTYLDIEFDPDDRLRCSINVVGTKNGRWSTGQTLFGTGTNMQNLPQQFKMFLEADPGCALAEFDKRQGEWVIVAYLSGDGNMIAVVESGEDAHTATGHLAFKVPKDLIKMESRLAGHETDPVVLARIRKEQLPEILDYEIPGVMTVRQAGKKSNHGLNYDMRHRLFATVNETPESEAKRIVDAYHAGYPGIRQWHKWVQEQLASTRTLENLMGRKRRFYAAWGDSMFKDGYAFQPQSTLVDVVNRALILMYHDQKRYMRPMDLLMQVHDSVLMQWMLANERFNRFARACWRIRDHMDPVLKWRGRQFVIATDMKLGLNWADFNPDRNPTGMIELEINDNLAVLEDKIAQTYRMLKQNERNL